MLIRSIREYVGVNWPAMRGERVVVIAVHRGDPDHGEILRDDAAIGALQPDDMVECVQIYRDKDGVERTTWVTSEVRPWDLGPVQGRWDAPVETTVVVTKRASRE